MARSKSPDESSSECEYQVEYIVDQNSSNLFLVKWKGYSEEENTWEPLENLFDCEPFQVYLKSLKDPRQRKEIQLLVQQIKTNKEDDSGSPTRKHKSSATNRTTRPTNRSRKTLKNKHNSEQTSQTRKSRRQSESTTSRTRSNTETTKYKQRNSKNQTTKQSDTSVLKTAKLDDPESLMASFGAYNPSATLTAMDFMSSVPPTISSSYDPLQLINLNVSTGTQRLNKSPDSSPELIQSSSSPIELEIDTAAEETSEGNEISADHRTENVDVEMRDTAPVELVEEEMGGNGDQINREEKDEPMDFGGMEPMDANSFEENEKESKENTSDENALTEEANHVEQETHMDVTVDLPGEEAEPIPEPMPEPELATETELEEELQHKKVSQSEVEVMESASEINSNEIEVNSEIEVKVAEEEIKEVEVAMECEESIEVANAPESEMMVAAEDGTEEREVEIIMNEEKETIVESVVEETKVDEVAEGSSSIEMEREQKEIEEEVSENTSEQFEEIEREQVSIPNEQNNEPVAAIASVVQVQETVEEITETKVVEYINIPQAEEVVEEMNNAEEQVEIETVHLEQITEEKLNGGAMVEKDTEEMDDDLEKQLEEEMGGEIDWNITEQVGVVNPNPVECRVDVEQIRMEIELQEQLEKHLEEQELLEQRKEEENNQRQRQEEIENAKRIREQKESKKLKKAQRKLEKKQRREAKEANRKKKQKAAESKKRRIISPVYESEIIEEVGQISEASAQNGMEVDNSEFNEQSPPVPDIPEPLSASDVMSVLNGNEVNNESASPEDDPETLQDRLVELVGGLSPSAAATFIEIIKVSNQLMELRKRANDPSSLSRKRSLSEHSLPQRNISRKKNETPPAKKQRLK